MLTKDITVSSCVIFLKQYSAIAYEYDAILLQQYDQVYRRQCSGSVWLCYSLTTISKYRIAQLQIFWNKLIPRETLLKTKQSVTQLN